MSSCYKTADTLITATQQRKIDHIREGEREREKREKSSRLVRISKFHLNKLIVFNCFYILFSG